MRNVICRRLLAPKTFFSHIWTPWAPFKLGMVCSNVLHQKSQLMTSSIMQDWGKFFPQPRAVGWQHETTVKKEGYRI